MHGVERIVAASASLVTIAGIIYTLAATTLVRRFARRASPVSKRAPAITVLKPICGLEPELEANLRSFCSQTYPAAQIVFCFRSADDPAVPIARRVIEAFPNLDLALAIDATFTAPNPKVANLAAGLALAKGELIVISDADVRVDSNFLSAIASAFDDEQVGAATCLYRGVATDDNTGSLLGALHINEYFAPSVLVSAALEPLRFALGAAMAVRRSILEEIGGLAVLGAHLGDDYVLGASVAQRGYTVSLAPHIVTCVVHESTLATHVKHQVRWARTIRAQRPLGYAFLFVTLPLPFAVIAFALGPNALTALLLAAAIGVRAALHLAACKTLRVRMHFRWLVPFSDLLELLIWFWAYCGRSVDWRSQRYDVGIGGRVQ